MMSAFEPTHGKGFVVIGLKGNEDSVIELRGQWRERNGWENSSLLIAVALW